jgi:cysteine desulfurase
MMKCHGDLGNKVHMATIHQAFRNMKEKDLMKLPIYFDYAATTPVDARVAEKMAQYLTIEGHFGNPASRSHALGWEAEKAVELARAQVAALINATDPKEIIWTSGATESDNLAIKGVAAFYRDKGRHIVTSKTEHKAVLDTCRHLEREGFEVTYLDPEPNGLIDLKALEAALRKETILVSLMHVNNEIGVISDIAAIGEITRAQGILLHVDAAQSAGKIPIDLNNMKVDLMSLSAHKVYGPKGMGALYVRRKPRARLEAQIHGGGHERGLRSGTLATHQIVGMGEAFRIAREEMIVESERVRQLRDRLWQGLKDIEEVYLNGDFAHRVPGHLNLSFNYIEGESLLMALKDLAVSSGSACTSASLEPSYVLRALGRSDELAHSSIRFTLGRFSTEAEVDYVIPLIRTKVEKLRQLSPLWDMYKEGIDPTTVQWNPH